MNLQPTEADEQNNRGIAFASRGRHDKAVDCFRRAIKLEPGFAEAHNNLGFTLGVLRRHGEAAAALHRAIKLKPDYADAHNNLGIALAELGRFDEAADSFRRAVALAPNHAQALNSLGYVANKLERHEEAIGALTRALKVRPDYADAYNNLGAAFADLKRTQDAVRAYSRALTLNPRHAHAHNNLGNALADLGRHAEALDCYARAVEINPNYAEAYNNMGLALRALNRHEDAIAAFARAIELDVRSSEAHASLGVTLADLRRPTEAIEAFNSALALRPEHALALAQRLHQQAIVCDWAGVATAAPLLPALGVKGDVVPPFAMLTAEDQPGRQRVRAERFAAAKFAPEAARPPPPAGRPERLRIGYFSADFHDHAVMYLIARLFELHDRGRFNVQAFSFGPERDDVTRARIKAGVDAFHDVRALRGEEIAALARREGVDIAVDLSGYTQRSRTGLFAHRPSPVQINFLGYPGTIGAPFMDYIVADATVIPEAARACYSEKIIYLPHAYQANDDRRVIAERAMKRAEFALPETGFVFCCFNNNYKITPAEFDIWMGLLREVEGSALWLLQANPMAAKNLRREAEARGVAAERIVFATALPLPEHLARHRLADLFLDTFVYNAHTTASDALWAGLPLVTKLGEGFAARVAGSLLNAVGLAELITTSDAEYAALALALARDPARLADVRRRLTANRATAPLFDTGLFRRHIEDAFEQAYARYLRGEAPEMIVVAP